MRGGPGTDPAGPVAGGGGTSGFGRIAAVAVCAAASLALVQVGATGASVRTGAPAASGAARGPAGQDVAAALEARVDSLAEAAISSGRAAGMTVAVLRGTDTLLLKPYGYADLELDVPTPEDAVYEIGSVTKQFTAAAVLLLAEEGALSLDDDLSRWLPDYPLGGRELTIRRLLDHTSGIKGYTEMPVFFGSLATQELPRDSLVGLFAAEPWDFEPGEALIYNNSAYFLLGLIVEEASGQPYEEFIEQRVFAAAGMEDSRYCQKDELIENRAEGYQLEDDALRPADYLNHLWPYAAGSLCSTARDLLRWNEALHGDGEGGDLLPVERYRGMITPEPLADGTPIRYAKGLTVTDRDGVRRIAHGGGIFGYLTELRYFPSEDLSIAVLVNTAGPTSPSEIANQVEEVVLGPLAERRPRIFTGDLEPFTGTFRGPARGRRIEVRVTIAEDGALTIRVPPGEAREVQWLGGDTFGVDETRYTFRRGPDGRFAFLHVDQVAAHYVLERIGS